MYWFAQLWRHRWMLILPMILVPAVLLGVLFTLPPKYMATAVVQLETATVRNLSAPNVDLLEKTLQSGGVLDTPLAQLGQPVDHLSEAEAEAVRKDFAKRLQLVPMEDQLVRINYITAEAATAEDILTTISLNFVQELMAPLRFRTDQSLSDLEGLIKQFSAKEKEVSAKLTALHSKYDAEGAPSSKALTEIVAAEFELQRVKGQREITQAEYDELLAQRQKMAFGFHIADPAALMWFVEPPQLVSAQQSWYGFSLKCLVAVGVALGLLLGVALILLRRATDNTFRNPEQVQAATGLQVLGNLPDLGQLNLSRGHLTINN